MGKIKELKWNLKKALLFGFFYFSNNILKYPLSNPEDAFFGDVDTVIHAGAHLGEERIYYFKSNLSVYWIEANPYIFKKLKNNLRFYRSQFPIQATLSDLSGQNVEFKISNSTSASSTLDFEDLEVTPTHKHIRTITTVTSNLADLIENKTILLGKKNLLLCDTQGTELEVIKGAGRHLSKFDYVIAEAQDYSLYKNQSLSEEIESYLSHKGFSLIKKEIWASNVTKSKNCYELVFKRNP